MTARVITSSAELTDIGYAGDAALTDLATGRRFVIRAAFRPGRYHVDFQTRTKADTAVMREVGGRSWAARPCMVQFAHKGADFCVAASYHTFNHHVVVASPADNIVGPPNITDKTARDAAGKWVPGHHMCIHLPDTWRWRADTAYTRDMRAKAEQAAILINGLREALGKENEVAFDMKAIEEQFDILMEGWLKRVSQMPQSPWSAEEGYWDAAAHPDNADAGGRGIVDGLNPQGFVRRQELAAVLGRVGLIALPETDDSQIDE